MKKWLIRIVVLVVVLLVLVVVAVGVFLDAGIKKGVETVGPMLTKVTVKLDSVSVSLLSGSGKIKGLMVGNPEGFKTPSAIQVGTAEMALAPRSLFAEKVVIKSIDVKGPEITYETDLKHSNLGKILENLEAASGSGTEPAKPQTEAKASKKLQVDNFVISDGKIHVSVTALAGKSATVPLPEIRLSDLGQGPDGITAAELTKRVLQAIEKETVKAASGAVSDLGKQAAELTKGLQKEATGALEGATKGVTDLFKKKK